MIIEDANKAWGRSSRVLEQAAISCSGPPFHPPLARGERGGFARYAEKVNALVGLVMMTALSGCAPAVSTRVSIDPGRLQRRALDCLKAAIRYPHNAVVRVEAVEALESSGCPEARPWIRTALLDDHAAVRFAGCVAVGKLRDRVAETAVGERLDDEDASVRVAALFARHRLGRTERTGEMAGYLLHHDDPAVRRNAALVLGLLDEPGAVKLLARAMRDRDAGVRHHTLEAMARLGNREAKQELTFMTAAGVGSEEVFALNALTGTGDRTYLDTFRYKLETALHLETRLAAARGLGVLGAEEGFDLALRALGENRPTIDDPRDPPAGQVLRKRQLAAAALGAIGRTEALPALEELMDDSDDPRVQVSAAKAILEIVQANRREALPFGDGGKPRG